jgi:hypothetical protein
MTVELHDSMDPLAPPAVLYNYDACAIAHALGRHRRLKELERLWAERPKDDPVLEGELAFAMAETGAPCFRPFVLDYVERVWGRAARSEAFERSIEKSLGDPRRSRSWAYRLENAGFDFGYRARCIRAYLFGRPVDVGFETDLLTRRDLPPYLRLLFISGPNYFVEPRRELLPVAREELARLRRKLTRDSGFAIQVADSTQLLLERIGRRLEEVR